MNPRFVWLCLLAGLVNLPCSAAPTSGDLAATREAFLKLIDRPKVPLAVEIKLTAETNGLRKFHFTYASDAEQRVPGILFAPATANGRRPVVIVMHGTGGTKNGEQDYLNAFVKHGFLGVAIDGRYHGERSKAGTGTADYYAAITKAYHEGKEHPFYFDTVWDVMRLVDYLETRADVDSKRIGLMGISKGGIETYLTAAVDPRIAAAVPCIGVQSFRWEMDNGQWKARIATIQGAFDRAAADDGIRQPGVDFVKKFYDHVVPGIYDRFDGPAMLPLIAPRPLLVINGDSDANTPMAGVRRAVEAARPVYQAAHAEEKLMFRIQENTGHTVTRESQTVLIEWLVRNLGAGGR